jgi:hypothetical protein
MSVMNEANRPRPDDEMKTKRIAAVSPEGRPAKPGIRGKQIIMLAIAVAVIVVIAAILVGLLISPQVGIGVGITGIVLGIGTNTALWISILRARERDRVDHDG